MLFRDQGLAFVEVTPIDLFQFSHHFVTTCETTFNSHYCVSRLGFALEKLHKTSVRANLYKFACAHVCALPRQTCDDHLNLLLNSFLKEEEKVARNSRWCEILRTRIWTLIFIDLYSKRHSNKQPRLPTAATFSDISSTTPVQMSTYDYEI